MNRYLKTLPASLLLALAGWTPTQAADAGGFDELVKEVQDQLKNASEQQILDFLAKARAAQRPFEASMVMRDYFSQHFTPPAAVVLAAAQLAEDAALFSQAASYYKRYLKDAQPDEISGRAAASLYTILIDLLDREDDAYLHMVASELRFREAHPKAGQFDVWFLGQAQKRGDFEALAVGLESIFAGQPAKALLHQYAWPALRHAFGELRYAKGKDSDIVARFAGLIERSGLDEAEQAELRYSVALFDYRRALEVEGEAKADALLAGLLSAAGAYVTAEPTADHLADVAWSLGADGSGKGRDQREWGRVRERCLPAIVQAFAALPAEEKDRFIARRIGDQTLRELGSPADWYRAGARDGRLFRHWGAHGYGFEQLFPTEGDFAKTLGELAKAVGDDGSSLAIAVRSLQAGNDLAAVAEHFFAKESWRLSTGEAWWLWRNGIEEGLRWKRGGADKGKRDGAFSAADWMAAVGRPWFATLPLMTNERDAVNHYLHIAWSADDDRERFVRDVRAIAWLPFTRDPRKILESFHGNVVRRHFDNQANRLRRDAKKMSEAEKAKAESDIAVRGKVEEAIKALGSDKGLDPATAPNPVARAYVELVLAGGDMAKQAEAGAPLLDHVRDFTSKRTPLAQVYYAALLERVDAKDMVSDFQARVFDALLGSWRKDADNAVVQEAFNGAIRARRDWPDRIRSENRDDALQLNGALAKALTRLIGEGEAPRFLWEQFVATRRGRGWHESSANAEVCKQIIDKKLFGTLYPERDALASVSAMALVGREFANLKEDYPVESWFDDLVIAEAKAKAYADIRYWEHGGKDKDGKVARAYAAILSSYELLPTIQGADSQRYDAETFGKVDQKVYRDSASSLEDAAFQAVEQRFGSRFDSTALGEKWFTRPMDLGDDGVRKQFFQRLAGYMERMERLPFQARHPNTSALSAVPGDKLTADETDVLVRLVAGHPFRSWSGYNGSEDLFTTLLPALVKQQRWGDLLACAPHLWRCGSDLRKQELLNALAKVAGQLVRIENDPTSRELAAAIAGAGLQVAKSGMDDATQRELDLIVSKVHVVTGGIPVPKTHAAYPVYLAQQNWRVGRANGAWDAYRAEGASAELRTMFEKFDPHFLTFLVDEHAKRDQLDEAENLVQTILLWMDDLPPGAIDAEARANILISQADIHYKRSDYAVARSKYQYVAEAEEFARLQPQLIALLRMADTDRAQKRYDEARTLLNKLARRPDTFVRAMAKFYLSKVRFDEEAFQESFDLVAESLDLYEDNSEARLFLNEVQKKLRNFKDSTFVDLGTATLRTRMVPGEPLTIQLKDKNKALAKRASTVDLTVWTELPGGDGRRDQEAVSLAPLGESGDIYEATLPTTMDNPTKGDGVLQVLGNERVFFDLSEKFKRDTNFEGGDTMRELRVLSDAEIYSSSSDIQTKDELAELRMREEIAKIAGLQTRSKSGFQDALAAGSALSEVRASNEVRPGNPFNLMVIDLDRNYTEGIDSVLVDISTTSGDRVTGLSINESEAFSGEFQTKVITAKRPAYAIASDARPGFDPNAVVSPNKSGELPPWIGQDGYQGDRHITVDLNDLVYIGQTKALGLPDRHIQRLIVQTSLNNRDFTTVGSYPDAFTPWNGSLQVDIVPAGIGSTGRGAEYNAITDLFDVRYLGADSGRQRLTPKSGTFVLDWDQDLKGAWDKIVKNLPQAGAAANGRQGGTVPMVTVRIRAAFWTPQRITKTFYLVSPKPEDPKARLSGPQLYIDGKLASAAQAGARRGKSDESTGPQGFPVELIKGLHVIEVVQQVPATAGQLAAVTVKTNTAEPPYTAELPADSFDLGDVPPALLAEFRGKPTAISQEGDDLNLDFAGRPSRVVKFWILEHDNDAPGMRQLQMQDSDGKQVLPIAADYTELRENETLEIAPGDTITVVYQDPHPYSEDSAGLHETYMKSTYHNGTVSAAFVRFTEQGEESFATIRRFDIGDTVKIFVRDNDLDTSDDPDRTVVRITTSEGKSVDIGVEETEPHSGIFRGTFFPVAKLQEGKPDQLEVSGGDDLLISYRDVENTDPGIPWDRSSLVEQAVWVDPQFRVYSSKSEPLPLDELDAAGGAKDQGTGSGKSRAVDAIESSGGEEIPPQYRLVVSRPAGTVIPDSAGEPITAVVGGPLPVEITWPTVCKASDSELTIYAQTKRGREKANAGEFQPGSPMDLEVPGTIEISGGPSAVSAGGRGGDGLPPAYLEALMVGNELQEPPMDAGTFAYNVPMFLGDCPNDSLVGQGKLKTERYGLFVTAGDEIYIGFKYQDQQGREHWFTQTVQLVGDALFDIMDRRFEEHLAERYVGEEAYLRVVDPMRNTSGKKDTVVVTVKTASGQTMEVELVETLSHSGIFKGLVQFVHEDDAAGLESARFQNGIAVKYGDEVTFEYAEAGVPMTHSLAIAKGSDGDLQPFTKKFKDPDIAMRTIFSIAEAYFEMAKKHRLLADEARASQQDKEAEKMDYLAREEIKQGQKLLGEAVRDFPDAELRAQADYLNAELRLELAKDTENGELKKQYYGEALGSFAGIIESYPDSEYAPKAQFKKALVYEKMGQMDLACAEYVKLSYKYPGNELIAETIARLGNYFLTQGTKMNDDAEAAKDAVESARIRLQAKEFFTTAGNVFSKLREHFPEHQLAAQTAVAAGMCYMWGQKWQQAHDLLTSVIEDAGVSEPEVKAEAYYWLGDTYVRMVDSAGATVKVPNSGQAFDPGLWAYQTFTKLTWEYPETQWARYARGQLTGNEKVKAPK